MLFFVLFVFNHFHQSIVSLSFSFEVSEMGDKLKVSEKKDVRERKCGEREKEKKGESQN